MLTVFIAGMGKIHVNHGPVVASSLVVCVGLPLAEVAALAASVGRGTLVMAAGDAATAWKLLGFASSGSSSAALVPHVPHMTPSPEVADISPGTAHDFTTISVGRLTIDPPAREVRAGDRLVRLSAREFDLLRLLASDQHRVWPFAALVQELWRTDYLGDHDQLASTVKRLRKRLGPDAGCAVQSVHGVGYRLLEVDSAVA